MLPARHFQAWRQVVVRAGMHCNKEQTPLPLPSSQGVDRRSMQGCKMCVDTQGEKNDVGAHVGSLGLAVHEDVESDALLKVVSILHVVVDNLLVILSAQLALFELQTRATQLCATTQQRILGSRCMLINILNMPAILAEICLCYADSLPERDRVITSACLSL